MLCAVVTSCFLGQAVAVAQPSSKPLEIEPGSFHFTSSSPQAGAHADWTTTFDFTHNGKGNTFNDVRNVLVNLPPGFVGNNTAVPTCTAARLLTAMPQAPHLPDCPAASAVGQIRFDFAGSLQVSPLYNMEVTSPGIVAELGFKVFAFSQVIAIRVRPDDSGLAITSPDIEQGGEVRDVSVTVWGVPASHEHDRERQFVCNGSCEDEFGGSLPAGGSAKPFLSNPTSCEPHIAHMEADSWEAPEEWSYAEAEVTPTTECERVPFAPSIEVQPTTSTVESPSGLDISLDVPQEWGVPYTLSTANLKDSKLSLPVGYTVNPSSGSGLGVCTVAQFESETYSSVAACPPESKIGTVDVETPVLAEKLTGNIYIAKPFENKFDSLLGLYIVVKDPVRGIVVRLAGHIEPDELTGQIVATFNNNPQVPFSRFTLKLRQGQTSPLVSPPVCGSYFAEANLTPWSTPLTPQLVDSPPFSITQGIGGVCPSGGALPFNPRIIAGTANNNASTYTPMYIRITRNDGEREITRFTSILPAGLTANLTGIPFCPNANVEAAKHVSGAQEETEPSCPVSSEIGHTLVGAGVGSVLAYTPGKVYMAGPYNGAPFSIVAITSARVGPFDLGTVVVREALDINPETAVVTVDAKASDPIPHIIDGIVVHVRDIRVYIDRANFMINPTNCNPLTFAATVVGAGADPANRADQVPVTISNHFQATNCQSLAFKPRFKVVTSGKTSRRNGASLTVKLTYPKSAQGTQTNIRSVKVDLPKRLPSRLTTLQKACPDSVFAVDPARCQASSIVGHATAVTPILPVPLSGPAYFVSHGGVKFPELVIVLEGYGVTIDLHGETFISKAGVTSSTFRAIPDEPVSSFELTLPQGPVSALAANGNLCKSRLVMPTAFAAQNGMVIHQSTKISVTGCAKHMKVKGKMKK
jgi:hypothetical protein